MRTVKEDAMKSIWELKCEYEVRTGKKVVTEKAYPTIGRGTVIHDWITHEEAESRFAKAIKIPMRKRLKWFLEERISRV